MVHPVKYNREIFQDHDQHLFHYQRFILQVRIVFLEKGNFYKPRRCSALFVGFRAERSGIDNDRSRFPLASKSSLVHIWGEK